MASAPRQGRSTRQVPVGTRGRNQPSAGARRGQGPCGSSTPPPSGLRAPPGPGQRSPACPPPGSRTWRRPANPLRRRATPEPPWAPSPESQHVPAHPGAAESLPRRRHRGLQLPQRNARPRAGGVGESGWSTTGDVVLRRHRADVRDGREEAAPPGAAPGQPRRCSGAVGRSALSEGAAGSAALVL